jgi:hypothetical protein
MRRQYHEATAAAYRAEAEASEARARAEEHYAMAHLCDYFEPSEALRTRRSLDAAARALSYRKGVESYVRLAESYETRAEEAKSDEIRQDYYSGPPGSYTGD